MAQDIPQSPNSASDAKDTKAEKIFISEEDLIHFGDLVEIDASGSFEYDWRGTLSPEGFLENVQFLQEPIYGLCQTKENVAKKVSASYSKFLRDPKINVRILDRSNRPNSFLSGAVKNPQRFQIRRSIRLNELLIISGGLTDRASGEIQIFRSPKLNCLGEITKEMTLTAQDSNERENYLATSQSDGASFINIKISDLLDGKREANPQILSGDIVNVLEAQPIYVIGGVENPTQISLRSQISLTRAIASAGGLSRDADETKITIFRREDKNNIKIIEVNLKKINSGQMNDFILQDFDIVEVAHSGKDRSRTPPLIENFNVIDKDKLKLPLRVID